MEPIKPNDRHEIEWLAFQYLSGELSDDACEAFERLLEVDQSAREAVAAGVELAHAVRFAYEDEQLSERGQTRLEQRRRSPLVRSASHDSHTRGAAKHSMLRWGLALAAVSASLLIVLWLGGPAEQRQPIASAGSSPELAQMWIDTRNEWLLDSGLSSDLAVGDWSGEALGDVEHSGSHHTATLAATGSAAAFGVDEELSDVGLPSWMVAAVEASRLEAPPVDSDLHEPVSPE